MAVISSMILTDEDQSTPILSPISNTKMTESDTDPSQTLLSETLEITPASENLLAEIQAIQEALQNDTDFDFSSLEPTSAGNNQNLSNDKSSGSPILLEDPGLLIHYRSDEALNVSSTTENSNLPTLGDTDISNDSALTAINNAQVNQIQASVSEDFITQAQGKFAPNLNITAQSFETQFGSFSSDGLGNWQYTLNNQLAEVQSLSSGTSINDLISLTTSTGQNIQIAIEINGNNDQAIITGTKQGELQASPIENINEAHPSISGKLEVSDIDSGEARFETNFDIHGNFGVAQINALGEWTYTLNNYADAVQGLRSGEKILDLFTVKTLDGSKQLIQINIEGVDDKPFLSSGGSSFAILDLESNTSTNGILLINDPDFGESSFQAHSGIHSSLGYGSAEIDSQGNWTFNLDIEYTKQNAINEGETRIDSFEVFTIDGTRQELFISLKGSNSPLYAQETKSDASLAFTDLLTEENQQDDIFATLNEGPASNMLQANSESGQTSLGETIETTLYLNSSHDLFQPLSNTLTDINIS
jgi:VCBS repeat-containing protein